MASAEQPEFDKRVAAAMASFTLSAPKRTKSELGLGDLSDAPIRFSEDKMVFKVVDVSPKNHFPPPSLLLQSATIIE
ncbi:MAG: hypothetical protein KIH08_06505 [Candidatus Freyarchaeota archaeon]|nr:hypothetical protein [Candidatus Jordarchaeia archaeon]MBS7267532.1 hypothetical protein [Candidatus Jordarchaeia archaeon]MBS7278390.1 hypothetical protein [Candidatus Jordarchaeia archaeon]